MSTYHPFIDGLRAVSILCVVLYHVGFSFIPGGFVGVDVFFVISGFLIINHVIAGTRNGDFRLIDFYSRRALRIVPAYLLVILVSGLISSRVLVFHDDFKEFGREVAYSGLMSANFYFLGQEGYFDGPRDTKILLHLWSLAVEEQFYLFTPLLIAIIWKLSPRMRMLICIALAGISFAACIVWTGALGDRNYAFYLPTMRAWEFIGGGSSAFLSRYAERTPRIVLEAAAAVGLIAILGAAFSFSADIPFPSYLAALPVFGGIFIITAGLAHPDLLVSRLLAWRPIVSIGLISYGWYLWHWPLLTLSRIQSGGERDLLVAVIIATISLGAAVLTRRFVEEPILRWRKRNPTILLSWKPIAATILACAFISATARPFYGGYLADLVATETPVINQPKNPNCELNAVFAGKCPLGAEGQGLLVGDSQADNVAGFLQNYFSQENVSLLTMAGGGCAPIWNAKIFMPDSAMEQRCNEGRAAGLQALNRGLVRPSFMIMLARWPIYVDDNRDYAIGALGDTAPSPDVQEAFFQGLRKTLERAQELGIERILIISPTPVFEHDVPRCLARVAYYGKSIGGDCSTTRAEQEKIGLQVMSLMGKAIQGMNNVRVINPLGVFCDESSCRASLDMRPLFMDTNHLADLGMNLIIGKNADTFRWLTNR
jgi:peptidoglycan/LPS O-acetylase OafA/YrhL